ncbi:hypothetical protein [Streptomyces natalensis]|uniref:hypothetical protein n=1 Tax=Streptomyces natalensis TaxID=68242 RepID=UPI0012FF57CB|nr:hypothetical protein [Streptomyces natalensis]
MPAARTSAPEPVQVRRHRLGQLQLRQVPAFAPVQGDPRELPLLRGTRVVGAVGPGGERLAARLGEGNVRQFYT